MHAARRSFPCFTSRARRVAALWALFALCLQLLAGGVSALHAAERLARQAVDVCKTAVADDQAGPSSRHRDHESGRDDHEHRAGPHCPFCVSHGAALPLLAVVLAFLLPIGNGADTFVADLAQAPPAAPALRHTPPRAPPFSLA